MKLFFREILLEDEEYITSLFIETYGKEPWNENWDREIAQKRISNLIKNSLAGKYCVTDKENKIIGVLLGYTNYFIDRNEFHIEEFFIDYNYQRKGIGKKLMEYSEKEIKQKGHTSIILLTKRSFPCDHFYRSIGFNISESMILMYKDIRR